MSWFRHHLFTPNVPEYIQRVIDQDTLSTYTSLDDYDVMYEARHGMGALDNSLVITEGIISTTFPMTIPSQTEPISTRASSKDPMTGQILTYTLSSVPPFPSQPGQTPVGAEHQPQVGKNTVSPVGAGHILGEGAADFTDMTEMMLTALDKQMEQSETVQKSVCSPVNALHDPDPMPVLSKSRQVTPVMRSHQPHNLQFLLRNLRKCPSILQQEKMLTLTCTYPTHRIIRLVISFMGILISVSVDNYPMILVELNGLSYKYGPTVYAVDRVNGTIYGRFNRGFMVISERAILEP